MFELAQRFGWEPDLSTDVIQEKLKEAQDQIKKQILTEQKLKLGMENLRKVTTDKKSMANLNSMVKKANTKLEELNDELQEVETFLLMTSASDTANHATPSVGEYVTISNSQLIASPSIFQSHTWLVVLIAWEQFRYSL